MAKSDNYKTLKTNVIQFSSGGVAGFVEVLIMHPMDLVKTRFQVNPSQYKSIFHCFQTMYRAEGKLSFYKGLLPPLLAETPKRAVKFFTFEKYKSLFTDNLKLSTMPTYFCAGFMAGFTEAFVTNPFERVKVYMQAQGGSFSKQLSAYANAKLIVKEHGFGLKGLNFGLTSTIGRHAVFNCTYFGIYFSAIEATPKWEGKKDLIRKFLFGFISGTISSCFNIPFDVAKSRLQSSPTPNGKYRSCFQTLHLVYKEEGVTALYRGIVPKILRLGPGGAIMLIIYEYLSKYLTEKFI